MDTTIALIFSLGLVLGGQDSVATGIEKTPDQAQNARLAQRQHKVQQRIKLTNAWLEQQKQSRRRSLGNARPHPDNTILVSALSCTADWNTA